MPLRNFRKNATPGFYNMRFKPSYGRDNIYFANNAHIHGANGPEDTKTNRDPTKFNYSNNIFKNDMLEWKTRGADYLY